MKITRRTCRLCSNKVVGRSDKIFCSVACKNEYHVRLRRATSLVVRDIDKVLHRNRSILLELMGKYSRQKKIPISLLEKKKFNFNYITKFTINSNGKIYYYVYDFSWMSFSDSQILINRRLI